MAGRQIRRGTAAQRIALGGLSVGEFGFETDTKDVYIGAAGGDQLIADSSALAFLNGQDQAVKTTAGPAFAHVHLTNALQGGVLSHMNDAPEYGLGISDVALPGGAPGYIVQLGGYYGLQIVTALGALTLTFGGKVGIGTAAPAELLDVNGVGKFVGLKIAASPTPYIGAPIIGEGSNEGFHIEATSANNIIEFQQKGTGVGAWKFLDIGGIEMGAMGYGNHDGTAYHAFCDMMFVSIGGGNGVPNGGHPSSFAVINDNFGMAAYPILVLKDTGDLEYRITDTALYFFIDGVDGNVGIGSCDPWLFGANAKAVLALNVGTPPAAHVDNVIQIYSVDSSDAAATLGLMLEQDVENIGTFTPSHKVKIKVNGTEYWIQLDAV